MPRKKAPESNARATSAPSSRGKAISIVASGEKGKEVRFGPDSEKFRPKAGESQPRVIASAPATAPSAKVKAKAKLAEAPPAKPVPLAKVAPAAKAPTAKARIRTKPAADEHLEVASRSILNLNNAVNGAVTADQIAERAYFRWLERGCPFGSPEEDWLFAEQELRLRH